MVDAYTFMVARVVPDQADYENHEAYVKYHDYTAQAELIDSLQASLAESEARVAGLLEDNKKKVDCGGPSTQPCKYDPPCLTCYSIRVAAENKRLKEQIASLEKEIQYYLPLV